MPSGYKEAIKKQEGIQLINKVNKNKENYSEYQYERAKLARKLYHNIGAPTVTNFKYLIKANMIKNCPVTVEDIKIAEKIFGKDVSYIKGKMMRSKPKVVKRDLIQLPKELYQQHHDITLHMDTLWKNESSPHARAVKSRVR